MHVNKKFKKNLERVYTCRLFQMISIYAKRTLWGLIVVMCDYYKDVDIHRQYVELCINMNKKRVANVYEL